MEGNRVEKKPHHNAKLLSTVRLSMAVWIFRKLFHCSHDVYHMETFHGNIFKHEPLIFFIDYFINFIFLLFIELLLRKIDERREKPIFPIQSSNI